MLQPIFNRYPKPTDWKSALILIQQAFESGFRASTADELAQYLQPIIGAGIGSGIEPTAEVDSTLPAPVQVGRIMIMKGGNYTQPDGTTPLVAPANSFNVGYWDGEEWSIPISIETEADLSGYATLEDINGNVEEGEVKAPPGYKVYKYATPLTSERILPEGDSFGELDRPDLVGIPLVIVDDQGRIVARIRDQNMYLIDEFDRPDLGVVYVTEDGYVLSHEASSGKQSVDEEEVKRISSEQIKVSEFIEWYTEFGTQDAYSVDPGITLADFYAEWDDIVANKINSPDFPPYVSKSLLGISTMNSQNIYRYDFRPPNPTRKVILVGCSHGWEKNPTYMLRRFFSYMVDNWTKHPMLQWARWNVHFIVVPVLNAGGYVPSTFPGSTSTRGVRYVMETEPFPATWTKTGDTVTIGFEHVDFPDTGGRLDAETYFAHAGVEGRVFVTVINATDPLALPDNAYRIATVHSGNTISITVPAGGASSGTCEILVITDPNRQYATVSPTWESYVSNSNRYAGPPPYVQDNKGTRPFSINESIYMRDLLAAEDDGTLVLLADLHAGAGDYITYYNAASGMDLTPLELNNAIVADFHTSPSVIAATPRNPLSAYASQLHDMAGFTPEWGYANTMSEAYATAQFRWMMNQILIASRFYNKKNK